MNSWLVGWLDCWLVGWLDGWVTDVFARTLSDCVSYLTVKTISSWTEALTDKLKKANRILRVLENVRVLEIHEIS